MGYAFIGDMEADQISKWPSTEGTVISSSITTIQHKNQGHNPSGYEYYPEIQYQFVVDGINYTGDTIRKPSLSFSDSQKAVTYVNEHHTGATITVYYDPDDPTDAVLEKNQTPYYDSMLGFGIFFVIIGVAGIIYVKKNSI